MVGIRIDICRTTIYIFVPTELCLQNYNANTGVNFYFLFCKEVGKRSFLSHPSSVQRKDMDGNSTAHLPRGVARWKALNNQPPSQPMCSFDLSI